MDTLKTLEKNGFVEIAQLHADNAIQFLVPREDARTLLPVLQQLDAFKAEKKRLSDSVWEYCTTPNCYRSKLLSYFGEKSKKNCDSCSNCIIDNSNVKDIIIALKTLLSDAEALSLKQLVLETTYSRERLLKALDVMVNEELIEETKANTFRLL